MLFPPIFCILLIFSGCTNVFMENLLNRKEGPYTGPYGDGSSGDPFRVYDIETLKKVGTETTSGGWTKNAHYRQERDIDIVSISWMPIGSNLTPFFGSYNGKDSKGKNRIIANLFSSSVLPYQGLFGNIGTGAAVKNVGLAGCNLTGGNYVGGIAGYNAGIIENCYVTGKVSGTDNVGGINGSNIGIVENCYSTANVTGNNSIGGIVGESGGSGSTVQYCYATGSIGNLTSNRVGGVVGLNSGDILYCAALNSNIKAAVNYGRVVGIDSGTLTLNFGSTDMNYDGSLGSWTPGGINGTDVFPGETPGHFNNKTWWTGTILWTFGAVWKWDSGRKLPVLR